jgi:ABC-type glycerol-3-phosphate transport system permease component
MNKALMAFIILVGILSPVAIVVVPRYLLIDFWYVTLWNTYLLLCCFTLAFIAIYRNL